MLADAPGAFSYLVARYSEPHRHYHTLTHVEHVLAAIDEWYPNAPRWILLAAFYHDVEYNPISTFNERDSARLASRDLAGVLSRRDLAAMTRAIGMTNGHFLKRTDPADLPLLVGDLIGMACSTEEYRTNTARIRLEYSMFDDEQWAAGRKRFIASFDGRRILPEEARFDHSEQRIHENLRDELKLLESD